MIYQLYFRKDQESRLFKSHTYKGFGLEPEVNAKITNNCPELNNASLRLGLVEYAAFLNIYRNNVFTLDEDSWIGFTSYRQLDKSPIIFNDKKLFEHLLMSTVDKFCGWGFYKVRHNASIQAEICHPNINSFIEQTLNYFSIKIPDRFYTDKYILFANYWAMKKDMFIDFMSWSEPIIKHSLTRLDHPYTKSKSPIITVSQDKWLGYYQERLFIIWYMMRNYNPNNFGPICGEVA